VTNEEQERLTQKRTEEVDPALSPEAARAAKAKAVASAKNRAETWTRSRGRICRRQADQPPEGKPGGAGGRGGGGHCRGPGCWRCRGHGRCSSQRYTRICPRVRGLGKATAAGQRGPGALPRRPSERRRTPRRRPRVHPTGTPPPPLLRSRSSQRRHLSWSLPPPSRLLLHPPQPEPLPCHRHNPCPSSLCHPGAPAGPAEVAQRSVRGPGRGAGRRKAVASQGAGGRGHC